ncbi:siphovirus Gp157 family protein [Weissella coleopterorum]|uniref:Siphovirus Gp157 family protein n=1 Tax=Weissella coleopterorum TaxID=2714949 RepID=A0A6G8AYD7_9LACO|nr:siphovirus Gp157 family protein [Weissella coleopterorum]QIL50078.1 siphovirus Gp157 family protein [Weissella coleopterorum]
MNLFNLASKYQQVYAMEEDSEGNPISIDVWMDTLESIDDAIEDKADAYAALIKTFNADVEAVDKEMERLQGIKKSRKNKVDRMKASLQEAMEKVEKTKFNTAINKFNIQNNPKSLDIRTGEHVPDEFMKHEAPKINRVALLAAMKKGLEVEGVSVKQTRSLRIK